MPRRAAEREARLDFDSVQYPAEFDPSNEKYRYSTSAVEKGNVALVLIQQEYCKKKAVGHLEHLRELNRYAISNTFLSLLADALGLDSRFLPPRQDRDLGDPNHVMKQAEKFVCLVGCIASKDGDLPLAFKVWLQALSDQAVFQLFNIAGDETANFEADRQSSNTTHGSPADSRTEAASGTTHEDGTQTIEPMTNLNLTTPSAAVLETCGEHDDPPMGLPDSVYAEESPSLPPDVLGDIEPYSLDFVSWMLMAGLPTSLDTYSPSDSLPLDPYSNILPSMVSPTDAIASTSAIPAVPYGHQDACQRFGVVDDDDSVFASLAQASDPNHLTYHTPTAPLVAVNRENPSLAPDPLPEDDVTREMPALPPAPESLPVHERPLSKVAPDLSADEIAAIVNRLPAFNPHHDSDFDEDFDDVAPPAPPPRTIYLAQFRVKRPKSSKSVVPPGRHGAVAGVPKQLRNTIAAPSTMQQSEAPSDIGDFDGSVADYPPSDPSQRYYSSVAYYGSAAQGSAVMNPNGRRLDTESAYDPNAVRYNSDPNVFDPIPPFRHDSLAAPSAPMHPAPFYSSGAEQSVPRRRRKKKPPGRTSMGVPSASMRSAPFYSAATEHNVPQQGGRSSRKRDATAAVIGYGDAARPAPAVRSRARHLNG